MTTEEVIVHGGLLYHVRLLEEHHDVLIFLVAKLIFQLVELRDALVVQVATLVALQERHRQLVHRVFLALLALLHVVLQIGHQALGCHVGTLIEALHAVARHLQAEVAVGDRVVALVGILQLAVVAHHGDEAFRLFLKPLLETFHVGGHVH